MKHTQVNHKKAALLGLQHLLAMYSGAIAVPLLIGTALKFNSTQMTYLVSIDIFMCGLATALQLLRNRYFGIGLPVVCCAREAAVLSVKGVGGLLSLKKFLPISKMDMIHVLSIQQAENFFLKVYVGCFRFCFTPRRFFCG